MEKTITFLGEDGEIILSFNWPDNKSEKQVRDSALNTVYHTIIYLLLILQQKYEDMETTDIVGYAEIIEENVCLLDKKLITYLYEPFPEVSNQFSKLIDIERQIKSILDNQIITKMKHHTPEWQIIIEQARAVLEDLNVDVNEDPFVYSEQFIDMLFYL